MQPGTTIFKVAIFALLQITSQQNNSYNLYSDYDNLVQYLLPNFSQHFAAFVSVLVLQGSSPFFSFDLNFMNNKHSVVCSSKTKLFLVPAFVEDFGKKDVTLYIV